MAKVVRTLSNRTDDNGQAQILLRVTVNHSLQFRIKSGLHIEPKRFRDGVIIRPRANQIEINFLKSIDDKLDELQKIIIDYCDNTPTEEITKEGMLLAIDRKQHPDRYEEDTPAKKSFFELFDLYIEKNKLSTLRRRHYEVVKRDLERYEIYIKKHDDENFNLDINAIDSDCMEDFENFLRNENNLNKEEPGQYKRVTKSREPQQRGNNTIICIMKKIRAFIRWCNKLGYTNNYPFDKYHIPEEKYGTPYYITLQERDQIADYDLSKHPLLAVQRDIFIFQCLIGCRVSDLLKMTKDNIIDEAIEYIPHKTKDDRPEVIRVPLNTKAKALIARYKGVDNGGRLFPFISAQKYNDDIKDIFKLCNITRPVTVLNSITGEEEKRPINEVASSHLARRTFVGNLYKKVKDPNLVGALSGHKEGSKAFVRYRDIDEDMKKELVNLID